MCTIGYFSVAGGLCAVCPSERVTMDFIIAVGITFAAIATVAIILVVIVQTTFRRSVTSGVGRALNYAAWVVVALSVQAQIGRSAPTGQLEFVNQYYQFLLLFEMNPSGARPAQCTSTTAFFPIVAMSISIACTALFALLGIPCLSTRLQVAGRSVLAELLPRCMQCGEEKPVTLERTPLPPMGAAIAHRATATQNPMRSKKPVTLELTPLPPMGAAIAHRATPTQTGITRARRAIAEYRVAAQDAHDTEHNAKCGGACRKKTALNDIGRKRKESRDYVGTAYGLARKACSGIVMIIHPFVANKAFRAIYCIPSPNHHGDQGVVPMVLAVELTRECFGPDHLPVFILAIVTIIVSIVGFPLFVLFQLSKSAGAFKSRILIVWTDMCTRHHPLTCNSNAPSPIIRSASTKAGAARRHRRLQHHTCPTRRIAQLCRTPRRKPAPSLSTRTTR
jgi:hypothetical protein